MHCKITYSDGSIWDGIATVEPAKGDVLWEPTEAVSYGSGD